MSAASEAILRMGGAGGAYFLARPGELVVEVIKQDLNHGGRHTELRALLVGPDRQVLQEATIPDDGRAAGSGPGPVQRLRLATAVQRAGIYALNITVSQDRYGDDYLWGFRTSCPRYLIETSRGHRDERHQEPLVLRSPDRPAQVCFAPRPGTLHLEVADLRPGTAGVQLLDGTGQVRASLTADGEGKAAAVVEAGPIGGLPWRLHLPAAQATVHLDGVTRWERGDPHADLSLWTDRPEAWFDFAAHRWMLTPYSRTVYAPPGAEAEVGFQVHHSGAGEETYDLGLELEGESWPVRLSAASVSLGPGGSAAVWVRGSAPPAGARARVCHLRITPRRTPEVTTCSTVFLHSGPSPSAQPLALPLQLRPYAHENEQLGYLPEYPVEQELYFDLENRPVAWTAAGLRRLEAGQWLPVGSGEQPMACSKVAFDRDGDLYAIAQVDGQGVLLHGGRGSRQVEAHALGGAGGAWDLEQGSGHNLPDGPPPVLHSVQVEADPDNLWRRICTLDLYLTAKTGGRIAAGDPIRISDTSLGVGSHSGIPAAVVSRGDRVHVIWAEPTDPGEQVAGVPTYVVTCDRSTATLGKPALIGYGAPPNDIHNRPSITMDGEGHLHALAGTHGQPFQYARSLAPNDAGQGWTAPVPVGDRQTYIGLVCGPGNVLHLVYRYWRHAAEPHPHSYHAALAYQRQEPGQPWSEPQVLVVAPFSEYSIYYHKLTIDRRGRLFLNYDYWSTYWFYRNDHRGRRRAVMMSPDGGHTWKLATSADLDG
ncbi:MAG: BNR-4 repeat-containing protein [Gemmatimonadota bacterium]